MPSKADLLAAYKDAGTAGKKRRKRKSGGHIISVENDQSSWKVKKTDDDLTEEEIALFRERQKHLDQLREENESGNPLPVVLDDASNGNKVENPPDFPDEKALLDERKKKFEQSINKQLNYEWGTGKADRLKHKKQRQDLEEIKSTKFSKFADDENLNTDLKEVIREGDPMAGLISTKPKKKSKLNKKKKDSVTHGEESEKRIYIGPAAPPNRFGIKPGYRWDGINRSNGFERKYLENINSRSASKRDQYRSEMAGM